MRRDAPRALGLGLGIAIHQAHVRYAADLTLAWEAGRRGGVPLVDLPLDVACAWLCGVWGKAWGRA